MDSPSSKVRHQTWIQSSKDSWHNQNVQDLPGPQCDPSSNLHSSTASSSNSIISDGCSDGKIESWLLGCGMGTGSENAGGLNAEHTWKTSCDDDLSLGADASAINHGDSKSLVGLSLLPPPGNTSNSSPSTSNPRQKPPSLNLGNSMASSCPSFSSIKTVSSVSEVLQSCSEDAEETLFQLGFGHDMPQPPARVPPRFFTFHSQLQGINFRLFLQSQLQRIQEEDPNLSIASRFRQVEALTATANAFYSLFSHVSRTPLTKLAPLEPNLALSPVEKLDRFRSAVSGVRSEPRSPVERLKDTVSKMCLYTGGARRASDGACSPLASPRRRRPGLPEVVGIVLENAKIRAPKKLHFLEPSLDVHPHRDKEEEEEEEEEPVQQITGTDVRKQKIGNTGCHKGVGTGEPLDMVESDRTGVESSDLDKSRSVNSVSMWPESGETASRRKWQRICKEADRNRDATERSLGDAAANSPRGIRVSHDIIFPAIVENSQHHALVCCSAKDYGDANHLPQVFSGRKTSPVRTCLGPYRSNKTCEPSPSRSRGWSMNYSDAEKVCRLDSADPRLNKYASRGGLTLRHQLVPGSIHPSCCNTVTGWEEDHVISLAAQGLDPSSNCPKEALRRGTGKPLSPLKHPKLKHISNKLHQANSFEIEEVSSAGEEDFGQSESTQITITKSQCKAAMLERGDSMQSDSSGFAEEEVCSSSERGGR
ncbi:uncharacterized protein tespa1 [Gadus chalcogrammus]|uniref:uncharacterized protein tespa1 n=1 Tax=Gadus chalcogrammus TaxID=1042646 RepID=UPI0024C48D2F|nr:uncharacterized protein tespa1 [Gadus chalcogrammus]XP_056461247.1 uncharacterized protein tespa1 [Gadus chalcogrammus]XP_056461248.1 uncharacterized protein tespa1 [Gadus chalcogrammus]